MTYNRKVFIGLETLDYSRQENKTTLTLHIKQGGQYCPIWTGSYYSVSETLNRRDRIAGHATDTMLRNLLVIEAIREVAVADAIPAALNDTLPEA